MEEGGKSQLWQYVQGSRATRGEPVEEHQGIIGIVLTGSLVLGWVMAPTKFGITLGVGGNR